jgi:hypothetical protein
MSLSAEALANGLALDVDHVLPDKPANPALVEGTSVWIYEENGAFGFPRLGLEAVSASWEERPFTANFAFEGGRNLIGASIGLAHPAAGADGKPRVLGAGPLRFECIEPFKRWRVAFEGPAVDTHVSHQMARTVDLYRKAFVRLECEVTMATPAWIQDNPESEATREAAYMGIGVRYEHLFRAEGVFTLDGQARPFRGTGLRIKRVSFRKMEGFNGHVWQSALFPDGSAFGFCVYTPNADGSESYNNGYIYQGGEMHQAKVVEAPWLRRLAPEGDDLSVVLESALGRTRIGGSSRLTHFRLGDPRTPGLTFQQGGALYEWNGQTAFGMIERSSPNDRVDFG